jgi:hypothetical protein
LGIFVPFLLFVALKCFAVFRHISVTDQTGIFDDDILEGRITMKVKSNVKAAGSSWS